MALSADWDSFLSNQPMATAMPKAPPSMPEPSSIYISTKTVIAYLDRPVDLTKVFWALAVVPYHVTTTGLVKKQMKFNSTTQEQVEAIQVRMNAYDYAYSNIMLRQESLGGIKDIRKVTIGISKKDVVTSRPKIKGAFYNCFVMILRIFADRGFKEFHVKVFNTGKVEIPGIQDNGHLKIILDEMMTTLKSVNPELGYIQESETIVLINSNFNCNYFLNRDKLYTKMREKHRIMAMYDPCSYPGIQCKLYFDGTTVTAAGSKKSCVSVMIFRTGSVLMVGKCTEAVLPAVYDFLNDLLKAEYADIVEMKSTEVSKKPPKVKSFRKSISVKVEY